MTQDAGLTIEEKRAFVAHTLAQEAKFRASFRRITDSADNRMRTRIARGGGGGGAPVTDEHEHDTQPGEPS